ncbi:MAG: hypothetical protein ACJAVZ_003461 [Afipia broomeae]|jgi:hypothetical protein
MILKVVALIWNRNTALSRLNRPEGGRRSLELVGADLSGRFLLEL